MMSLLKRILRPFATLRLTIFTLAAALVLVFAGTLAQVRDGLYYVQEAYFQSWIIWWQTPSMDFSIPVYPGGHLIGAVLLVNLIAAHIARFSWNWRKFGIQLTHLGLIIMLAGGLVTDLFSVSSYMHLREGETKDFSQDDMNAELAVVDMSDPEYEVVTAISGENIEEGEVIEHASLPFRIEVQESYRNSRIHLLGHGVAVGMQPAASHGTGQRLAVEPLPLATKMDERNIMSAVIELITENEVSLGTWLVSDSLTTPQMVQVDGKTWNLELRAARYYKPFSLTLLDFTHKTYPGTNIPKDFSSTVMLNDQVNDEHRKVRIYMNHPFRHGGETYYQSGFNPDNQATVLQVVRNPGYQTPYVACVVMSIGLIYQFSIHLFGFVRRSKKLRPS